MAKPGRKPKLTRHDYSRDEKNYILMLKATVPFDDIPEKFREKFGWAPSKSVISRAVANARKEVRASEPKGISTEQEGTAGNAAMGTISERDEKKVFDGIVIQKYIAAHIASILQDVFRVLKNGSDPLAKVAELNKMVPAIGALNKTLDSIYIAEKVVAGSSNVTVNQGCVVVNLEGMGAEDWQRLKPIILREFCGRCPLRQGKPGQVVDVEEAAP